MKNTIKSLLNLFCRLLVIPLALPCKLEEILISKDSETIFHLCSQFMALIPGLPGVFLRRAFYSLTLEKCSTHCHIGFGTLFSHRNAVVEEHVYIGNYSMVGAAHLGSHCLIGSRVSILSGKALHVLDENGMWSSFSPERMVRVTLAPNVWIGEGAIVMADIGTGSMVGAGAVVTSNVRSHVIVAGNPARFIRNLQEDNSVNAS